MKKEQIEQLNRTILWCNDFITEFVKSGAFDPFTALTGENSKQQKLYIESVNFLGELSESLYRFKDIQKKYI